MYFNELKKIYIFEKILQMLYHMLPHTIKKIGVFVLVKIFMIKFQKIKKNLMLL